MLIFSNTIGNKSVLQWLEGTGPIFMARSITPLAGCLILVASVAACNQYASDPEASTEPLARPNIILIVADDLGLNDVGFNGNPFVHTPNIDALARASVEFTSAYATSSVCSTSRAGLITGIQQQRFGMESNPSPRQLAQRTVADEKGAEIVPAMLGDPEHAERGLPPEAVTIAEHLSNAGYKTVQIGKWHLGSAPGYTPLDQGFDDFVGFLGGASMFAERDDADVVGARLTWSGLDNFLWERLPYSLQYNGEPSAERGYQTDVFTDAAIKYIRSSDNSPYFLNISYNAPHNPLQAPKRLVEAQSVHLSERERVYYAMVQSLDEGIGRILKALEETGADKNTIIILTSDNGGASYVRIDDVNSPYRGFKANFWEGGIRVPLLVRLPGVSPKPERVSRAVSLLDIAPTLLEAADINAIDLDGISLFPAEPIASEERAFIWRNHTLSSIRAGDWKLIKDERRDKAWLYDLSTDPLESKNVIAAYPEMVAELETRIGEMTKDWPASPAWGATYRIPIHADPQHESPPLNSDDWVMWPG